MWRFLCITLVLLFCFSAFGSDSDGSTFLVDLGQRMRSLSDADQMSTGSTYSRPEDLRVVMATRMQDVFSAGFDLPANNFRRWSPEFIEVQLRNVAQRSDLEEQVDLQYLYEMNMEAARIWEELKKNADPEQSRAFVFEAKTLQSEIGELHKKAVSFLQTSSIGEIADQNRTELFIEMHPLLSQVFENIIAVWFPLETKKGELRSWARLNEKSADNLRMARNIVNLMSLLPRHHANPVGLWPLAISAAHAYYYAKLMRFCYWRDKSFTDSPGEAFVSRDSAGRKYREFYLLEAINPFDWIAKIFIRLPMDIARDNQRVEPTLDKGFSGVDSELSGQLRMISDSHEQEEAVAFYRTHARDIALEIRKLGERYGVTRNLIFSAGVNR